MQIFKARVNPQKYAFFKLPGHKHDITFVITNMPEKQGAVKI